VSPDVERGRHIATALAGCADCHGADFGGGRAFVRDGVTVYAANLTAGVGGIGQTSDADVARAIRFGTRPDGSRLRVMPAREYAVMTDGDLADLLAFLRSLQPVDRDVPRARDEPSATVGAISPPPARDPNFAPPIGAADAATQSPVTLSPGAYIVTIAGCTNCHAANLAGSARPGGGYAPNISHDGIGTWSFADFTTAMRTGKTPDGRVLAPAMPWKNIGKMTDAELRTVYDYLESQPPHDR
jgi:cytochrome c553